MTPDGGTPLGRFLYALGSLLFTTSFRTLWRLRVIGRENVPQTGGVLLASNHVSFADPPLVGSTAPRRIHFMAKQELFDAPVFGWLIRQVNAFPIRRVERDVGAFRTAQRILSGGGALIVFPEGTRQRHGGFGKPKPGVAMLSMKTGSPVVPVYVHNSGRIRSFARLGIAFGRPLRPEGETDYQVFSEKIMREIQALKEAYFGTAS